MRTQTRKIYTFSELRKAGREHAIEVAKASRENSSDVPWMDEIMDSLKGLFKAVVGVDMSDWSVGPHSYRTHLKAVFYREEVENLSGPRAMAWLENNLLGRLRVEDHGKGMRGNRQKAYKLKDALRYGYRIGSIPDCPFTGYCADDDLLDALRREVKEGRTLKGAFQGLAEEAATLMEHEIDYYMSDESIIENLKGIGHEFLFNGDRS